MLFETVQRFRKLCAQLWLIARNAQCFCADICPSYTFDNCRILLWTHAQRASMLYFADVFYLFLCAP